MTDTEQLLVTNFIEALGQVQRYIVLGLGTSISALALAFRRPAPGAQDGVTGSGTAQDGVTIPGIFVAINPGAAQVVLLGLCFVVGAMANFSAETANLIADRLQSSPDLLRAASMFPSVATSPYAIVRYLAALFPLVFSLAALIVIARRERSFDWEAFGGWCLLLVPPYGALALQVRGPIGSP
jgi:hypothetical protein